jgi:hypothetical protein
MGPPQAPPAAAAPTQSVPPAAAVPVQPSGAGVSAPPPATGAPVQPPGSAPQAATAAARPTSQLSKIDEERLAKIEAMLKQRAPQYLDRSQPNYEAKVQQGLEMVNNNPKVMRMAFFMDRDMGRLSDDEVRRVAGLFAQRLLSP